MPSNRGISRPMVFVRPDARRCALGLGRYRSFLIASCTRRRLSSETVGTALITRETVVVDTPAAPATSAMLIFFIQLRLLRFHAMAVRTHEAGRRVQFQSRISGTVG